MLSLLTTSPSGAAVPPEERIEPELPYLPEAIERALSGAEFRDVRARDRLRSILSEATEPSAAVFAKPPDDLPALLRMADQLDRLARLDAGERALVVWECPSCHTRYAVPVALARHVAIPCERCGTSVELFAERALGEESLLDPFSGAVNDVRRQLAAFFREAMARGWPVLVAPGE
jgi:hypothetical protein